MNEDNSTCRTTRIFCQTYNYLGYSETANRLFFQDFRRFVRIHIRIATGSCCHLRTNYTKHMHAVYRVQQELAPASGQPIGWDRDTNTSPHPVRECNQGVVYDRHGNISHFARVNTRKVQTQCSFIFVSTSDCHGQ